MIEHVENMMVLARVYACACMCVRVCGFGGEQQPAMSSSDTNTEDEGQWIMPKIKD